MATEQIKITIAGKSFKLNVDSTKRELYLLAERTLNASITKFEKRNFEGVRQQDAVALAAFELSIANISMKQKNEIDSAESEALATLDERIANYLNAPSISE